MNIGYALYENTLRPEPHPYAARVQLTGSADLDAIVERITEHGSMVTESAIRAVLLETISACESLLLEGYRVNLGGLCELFPRVSGNFESITDHFDPARHRVDVGSSPGAQVRHAVRERARVTKVETVKPSPLPLEYVDFGSGETNGHMTPGNIGTVNGNRLKLNPDKADEGVFLIPTKAENKETRIGGMQRNKPGQLVFLLPGDLAKGDYRLEVRARVKDGSELRMGRLDEVLSV